MLPAIFDAFVKTSPVSVMAITPLPDCFNKARFSEILVGGNDGGIPENGGGCNESISRVIIDP